MILSLASTSRNLGKNVRHSLRFLSSTDGPIASTSTLPSPTDYYRITLRRSAIGLPQKYSRTLASLGLRKRLQSVYLPQRSDIAGMILTVKELVHVENVRQLTERKSNQMDQEAEEPDEIIEDMEAAFVPSARAPIWVNEKNEVVDWGGRAARKAPRGYRIVGNISNEMRNEEIQSLQRVVDTHVLSS